MDTTTRIPWLAKALSSGLFTSYIPARMFSRSSWTGAGFLGTVWGWLLLRFLPVSAGGYLLFLCAAILLAAGLTTLAEKSMGRQDDPRIILDETVGYWVSAAFLPRTTSVLLAAFVLFRILDACKPPGLRSLEKLPGGLGIVSDDVAAGIAANLILRAGIFCYGKI